MFYSDLYKKGLTMSNQLPTLHSAPIDRLIHLAGSLVEKHKDSYNAVQLAEMQDTLTQARNLEKQLQEQVSLIKCSCLMLRTMA